MALMLLALLLPLLAVPAATAAPSAAVRPVPGEVAAAFDPPEHPYGPGHRGVDLAAEPGAAVRAALPGVVSFAGRVAGAGWVTVEHGPQLDTTYGHLDPILVTAGRRVEAGDVVGRTAPDRDHLDWGARLDGVYVDPLTLLLRWRPHLVAEP